MAMSAFFSSICVSELSFGYMVMPMLVVIVSCRSAMWYGWAITSRRPRGQRLHVAGAGKPLQHHGELVAAEAGHDVAGAHGAPDAVGHFLQEPVAGVVAERVVDDLERVQVEEEQRHLAAVAARAGRGAGELVVEELAVGDAGQRVVLGQVVEVQVGLLALDGVADRAQDRATLALPLHQVVLGALVQDADGELLVVLAAQHDDRDLVVDRLDGVEALQARSRRAGAGRAAPRRRCRGRAAPWRAPGSGR